MPQTPMVSAVCISHSSRFGLLQRAILNFLDQDYPAKELLVVTGEIGHAERIRAYLRDTRLGPAVGQVRLLHLNFRQISDMLLHTLAKAYGAVIAAWDDDTLSHPDRFKIQLEYTTPKEASVLGESLYYYYDTDEVFVTSYAQPAGRASDRCASSSLMFYRESFSGYNANNQLPWSAQVLETMTHEEYLIIPSRPMLFLAGSNGNNLRPVTWHRKQGSMLPATWKADQLQKKSESIEQALKKYSWPTAKLDVCGKDGVAMEVTGVPVWPSWLESVEPPEDWELRIPNAEYQDLKFKEHQSKRAAEKANRPTK